MKKADKKVRDIQAKMDEVKQKIAALKSTQASIAKVEQDALSKIRATKEAKIAAAKAKYDKKMAEIRAKYGPRDGDGDGILNEEKK